MRARSCDRSGSMHPPRVYSATPEGHETSRVGVRIVVSSSGTPSGRFSGLAPPISKDLQVHFKYEKA
jgi:hypothetical protein